MHDVGGTARLQIHSSSPRETGCKLHLSQLVYLRGIRLLGWFELGKLKKNLQGVSEDKGLRMTFIQEKHMKQNAYCKISGNEFRSNL